MNDEMLDMMAMEEMMGGAPMPSGNPMAGGMGGDMEQMVPVMVPVWAVPAVEELIVILGEAELGDEMGGMPADPSMGGMPMQQMPF
jgi:hypothetical protein